MSRRVVISALFALFLISAPLTFAETHDGKPANAPPELAALEFLIGDWDLTTSFANADGSTRQSKARLEARYAVGGFGISVEETHGYAADPSGTFVSFVLYTVQPKTRSIVGASNNSLGNRKNYDVTIGDDRIFITQTGELFEGRKGFNKLVLFNISPDRYELRLDACNEDGVTCVEGGYSYVAERHKEPMSEKHSDPTSNPLAEAAKSYLDSYIAQDLDSCAEKLAEEAVFQDSVMVLRGRDEVVAGLGRAFQTFTIDGFKVTRWIESGPLLIAVDGVVRFHQDGAFAGRPGLVLHFEIPMVVMLEFEAGRVIHHVDLIDVPAFQKQLAALLSKPSRE